MKDVPPYTLVGGNRAREIKKRFDAKVIERLLRLHIYDLPEEKLANCTILSAAAILTRWKKR